MISQYAFDETGKHKEQVDSDISKFLSNQKPVRYVRQPSTQVYAMIQWLVIQKNYAGPNDLIDDIIKFIFREVAINANQETDKGAIP